ncbi:hypothetical protein [Saccharopolyspora pogona]|uniref:hypothetical protein n=1 Tax=Saccharopolyspora pogona TaxID=333966 RepID=UPI00168A0FED|nr:hypothetical protein [Saccharopolyspora pogona]
MPAPTDPAILRERLDGLADLLRDAEPSPSGLGGPLSTSPLPVAALQDHLGNATSWLGRVWAGFARDGAAVRRWLVSEPLGSPIPPQEPTALPLRKQFRLSLATAALGAGIAAAAYTLTAPLADPFFGLIPPGIFNRLPPFAENTVPAPDGEAPLLNTNPPHDVVAPGLPLVARTPGPPQPPPPPPSAAAAPAPPETGSSDGRANSPVVSTRPQDSTGSGAAPIRAPGAARQQGGVAPAKPAAPPPASPPAPPPGQPPGQAPEISDGPTRVPTAPPQTTTTHQPPQNTTPDPPTRTTTHERPQNTTPDPPTRTTTHERPQNTTPDPPTRTTTHERPQNTTPDPPTRTTTHERPQKTTPDPPAQTTTHEPTQTPEPTPTTTATEPTTDPTTTHNPSTTAPAYTTDRGTS